MPASQPLYSAEGEMQLMMELWDPRLADDLREFVRFVYPWGKAGTPLAELDGPRNWQDELLKDISDYIKSARDHQVIHKAVPAMYKAAVASGRGIGKSATFSWLAHWLVTTRLGSSTWVTANGEPQLKTKTFPEISKWITLAINSHWFDIAATKIEPAAWLREAVARDMKIDPKYWYIAAQLWSEENPDAFAGAHNVYGEMYLFDEASGIPSPIWTVAQGVFTEQIIDRYWLAFSNPRRNDGAFYECFHNAKYRKQWRPKQIDSRTVNIAADVWEAIIEEHGADSDSARIEVYGQFPSSGEHQFIPLDSVVESQQRFVIPDPGAPLLMGVDVGRGGDDSIIAFRKGRDARSIPWITYTGSDTHRLANIAAEAILKYRPDAVFVDGGGVGGGVVDNLKAWGHRVVEVQFGSTPNEPDRFANKRTEIWALMKEWLSIGAIPDGEDMRRELIGPWYSHHPVNNKLQLETKEQMAKRRVSSPNMADALAVTFAQTVARNDTRTSRQSMRGRMARDVDYDMFSR